MKKIRVVLSSILLFAPINAKCAGKSIYSICKGYPTYPKQFDAFKDPYDVSGKCFFMRISAPNQNIQWINKNSLIVFPFIQGQNPIVFIDDKNHVKYNNEAIVIGVDPIQYQNTMGSMITAPTFKILKYTDYIDQSKGSGSLGEPIEPIKANIYYPEAEHEDNIEGKVDLLCKMFRNKNGFLETRDCKPKNQDNSQSYKAFLNSSLNNAYNSSWRDGELKEIDKNYNATLHYNFELSN
ncbi:hypothetical protein [Oenococcus oeni]|uniref:hypothetical protein n=1 Tax=Oenococcus oeni TaxID=1247 RepID=UPI00050E2D2A|nr:hypothetical protein [Oenococcus oeni]KGH84317.1 hypothetical protein X292_09345 [Oenococcus oeni IOEB_C28]